MKKVLRIGSLSVLALVLSMQLVPYGRHHTNPPVTREPPWDSSLTRELAKRACFDCHSNETRWPWYSNVAPVSWLVQSDVDEGREILNFSEWQRPYEEAHEAPEAVLDHDMPPWIYLMQHRPSQLTADERNALATGLRTTLGARGHTDRDD